MTRALITCLTLALLPACAPEVPGPVRVAIFDRDEAGAWGLQPVTLKSLSSLSALEGEAAKVVTGAKVVRDVAALGELESRGLLSNPRDVREEVLRRRGHPPGTLFTVGPLKGEPEVHLPEDFDTLAMATAWYHLEAARRAAVDRGMSVNCLRELPLYFEPVFEEIIDGETFTRFDNAYFWAPLGGFVIEARRDQDAIPLSMNGGLVAHEYAHGVWNCIINDNAAVPRLEHQVGDRAPYLLWSVDEGLADYFGASLVGDANFLEASLPGAGATRDLKGTWRLEQATLDAVAVATPVDYDPYPLGTVLASALWSLREESANVESFDRAVLESLHRLRTDLSQRTRTGEDFSLVDYLDVLVTSVRIFAVDDGGPTCTRLEDRFAPLGGIPSCL